MNIEFNEIRIGICLEEIDREIKDLESKIDLCEEQIQVIEGNANIMTTMDLDRHVRAIKKDVCEIQQLMK